MRPENGRTIILQKITNDGHWEICVSLLVMDGVSFIFIIVEFSVINLIKAHIFSIFQRRTFPEKAVSILKLSSSTFLARISRDLYLHRPIK